MYELMGVDGVRSVNEIVITQDYNYMSGDGATNYMGNLYSKNIAAGNIVDVSDDSGTAGYGFFYNFADAVTDNGSMIIPSVEPAVFELKEPTKNIKGLVR